MIYKLKSLKSIIKNFIAKFSKSKANKSQCRTVNPDREYPDERG